MEKQLSIIIPVFNGERYIAACLTSLLGQLTDRHEVILINDGSTDATHEIVTKEFSDQMAQGKLVYISIENGGVSAARNLGLDAATGAYLAFVDARRSGQPRLCAGTRSSHVSGAGHYRIWLSFGE